jgi:hypothetical protein
METTAVGGALALLRDFAETTGLAPARADPDRYLWTDAFAVCTYLGLAETPGRAECRARALALIEQVHDVLGRFRPDSSRAGRLSGLGEEEGARYPTAGGLRIGKPLPERSDWEPFDERLEWDRDGQYYHYLTKWMHALCRATAATGDPVYAGWAADLVKAVHPRFLAGPRRMYWKMSTDLSRPLVASMGQHDPLDGYVTYAEVHAGSGADLSTEMREVSGLLAASRFATDDPLGTGGLLFDAFRIASLVEREAFPAPELLEPVLDAAVGGVVAFSRSGTLRLPAAHRLAFRELGLALGLRAAGRTRAAIAAAPDAYDGAARLVERAVALERSAPLADAILAFWLDPRHRAVSTWTDHRAINGVTLATCLAPNGLLRV